MINLSPLQRRPSSVVRSSHISKQRHATLETWCWALVQPLWVSLYIVESSGQFSPSQWNCFSLSLKEAVSSTNMCRWISLVLDLLDSLFSASVSNMAMMVPCGVVILLLMELLSLKAQGALMRFFKQIISRSLWSLATRGTFNKCMYGTTYK